MGKDHTGTTEETARQYYHAWTSHDSRTVAALLAKDFRFSSGDTSIEGKDAFLSAGAFPHDAQTTMVAEAYQGETAFQMYDATRGANKVRIVEQLTVRGGLVRSSNFVADRSAFMALMNLADKGSA